MFVYMQGRESTWENWRVRERRVRGGEKVDASAGMTTKCQSIAR